MSNNVDYKNFLEDLGNKLKNDSFSNSSFNIFQILGIEAREVLACRFIGWLLEPNVNHGLGRKPVKLFLEHVLGVEDNIDNNISVTLEDHIDNDRRVDIVIENGDYIYPIEVKIWAGDQDKQLNDYYNYYFKDKNYKGKKIYYLTPMGWEPSEKSKAELSGDEYRCISFKKQISNWLEKIVVDTGINDEIKSIVKQYIGVIENMCKESNLENSIIEATGLNANDFNDTKLRALIMILKANGDKNSRLQRVIQKKYLLANLEYDKKEYVINGDLREVSQDKHAVLSVKKDGKIIAWICVDEMLYIGCKKLKYGYNKQIWKDECWAYISPQGNGKKFKLDDCENIFQNHGRIDIQKLLDDIKQ